MDSGNYKGAGMAIREFFGMKYEEREALKVQANELFHKAATTEEKVKATEMVIQAHFERSREAHFSRRSRSPHPDFDEYASHWLCALDYDDFLKDPAVLAAMVGKYGKPKVPMIPHGESYWGRTKAKRA